MLVNVCVECICFSPYRGVEICIFWVEQFVPAIFKSATVLSESCTCVQMFHRDVQSQQNPSDIFKQLAGQDTFTDQFQTMAVTKKSHDQALCMVPFILFYTAMLTDAPSVLPPTRIACHNTPRTFTLSCQFQVFSRHYPSDSIKLLNQLSLGPEPRSTLHITNLLCAIVFF